MEKKTIHKTQFFDHSIEKVWKAISDQKEISQWFTKTDFEAVEGQEYKLFHESVVVCGGKVLEVQPPIRLVYSWINPDTTIETVVTWQLQEKDKGTELILTHEGYELYEDQETVEKLFGKNSAGWDHALEELTSYLGKTN